eukprot:146520-Chlamydomonas_euryale.AAC.3
MAHWREGEKERQQPYTSPRLGTAADLAAPIAPSDKGSRLRKPPPEEAPPDPDPTAGQFGCDRLTPSPNAWTKEKTERRRAKVRRNESGRARAGRDRERSLTSQTLAVAVAEREPTRSRHTEPHTAPTLRRSLDLDQRRLGLSTSPVIGRARGKAGAAVGSVEPLTRLLTRLLTWRSTAAARTSLAEPCGCRMLLRLGVCTSVGHAAGERLLPHLSGRCNGDEALVWIGSGYTVLVGASRRTVCRVMTSACMYAFMHACGTCNGRPCVRAHEQVACMHTAYALTDHACIHAHEQVACMHKVHATADHASTHMSRCAIALWLALVTFSSGLPRPQLQSLQGPL